MELPVGAAVAVSVAFPVTRVEMGVRGVIQVVRTDRPNELLVKAEKQGSTDLYIYSSESAPVVYGVSVVEDIQKIRQAVSKLVEDIAGIEVETVADKVVIRGRLLRPEDVERVNNVVKLFQPRAVSLAALDSGPFNGALAREIRDRIQACLGDGEIRVDIVNEKIQLAGDVYDEAQRQKAGAVASQYNRPVLNLLNVTEATVEIDAVFAKFTRTKNARLGANLLDGVQVAAQGTVTGGRHSHSDYTWSITAAGDLATVLKLLASNGIVKQLAKPHLSAKSGKGGIFHSGGVLYVPVANGQTADLREVEYGLFLKVAPVICGKDSLTCDIEVSVRAPIGAASAGLASLNVAEHKIQTSLRCRLNETMILSGVISSIGGDSLVGLPILRNVPVLGCFLGQRNRYSQDEELIILMTPRVITTKAARSGPFSEETLKALRKAEAVTEEMAAE